MMKNLKVIFLAIILVCLANTLASEATVEFLPFVGRQRASFVVSYSILREHEGGYSWVKHDKGQETYCGISRRFYPGWSGWSKIDQYKKLGKVRQNSHFDELNFLVQDFYLDIWVKEDFFSIQDQQLANYVFDFRVNGSNSAVVIIQQTLRELGSKVKVDGMMGQETVANINSVDKYRFLYRLKARRLNYYKELARLDETQRKWLGHWLKRAERVE